MKFILTKVKFNRGVMDNGKTYDYTRVSLQMPISEDSQTEFGVDTLECEFGKYDRHIELLHLKGKLPCEVDVEMTQVMEKGKLVTVVTSLRTVNVSRQKVE